MGSRKRVLGVLAGNDYHPHLLQAWADSATMVIAADGGADSLLSVDRIPHLTIGDMDSITEGARLGLTDLHPDGDQDTSDCDKLLVRMAIEAPADFAIAGIEGDRLDHVLASVHSIVRSGLRVQLALRTGLGLPLRGGDALEIAFEGRVSLIPIDGGESSLEGVRWPFARQELKPGGFTSISNQSPGKFRVECFSGSALLVLDQGGSPDWSLLFPNGFSPSH